MIGTQCNTLQETWKLKSLINSIKRVVDLLNNHQFLPENCMCIKHIRAMADAQGTSDGIAALY